MCHGYEAVVSDAEAKQSVMAGGYGLQFTGDNVTSANVSNLRILRGSVRNIVVFACAAADVGPRARNTAVDGALLCSEMAAHSGATVYASSATQWYTRSVARDVINFGFWEGNVYRFDPTGHRSIVESNPLQ
jgi:hypothetical protein